uniref:neuronal PAS domain-containing protein 3-like n=1 Tax=Myxine glutinosa TaxID=7769 RepID=UPI00358E666D
MDVPNASVKGMRQQHHCQNSSVLTMDVFEQHLGSQILQSLDGFVFTLNYDGRFLYISETVSIYLGLSQVEMAGSSSFDYVHPGDHAELADQLGMKLPQGRLPAPQLFCDEGGTAAPPATDMADLAEMVSPPVLSSDHVLDRSFVIRMKSTLTKRGVHVKSSGYKVIHVTGRLRVRASLPYNPSAPIQAMGLVALAHALPPPTMNEIRIDCQMFVTRLNFDLKIVHCESRISDYMDHTAGELPGRSCYHFIHGEDVEGIRQNHIDLLKKGQCVTKYYRWMQKSGGYVWIQSSATIAINTKNVNEKTIVWINYVLSDPEFKDCPLDVQQLPHLYKKPSESSETSDSDSDSKGNSDDRHSPTAKERRRPACGDAQESGDQRQPSHYSNGSVNNQEEGGGSSSPEDESSEPRSPESSDCEGVVCSWQHVQADCEVDVKEEQWDAGHNVDENIYDSDSVDGVPSTEKRPWQRKARRLKLHGSLPERVKRIRDVNLVRASQSKVGLRSTVDTVKAEDLAGFEDSTVWDFPPNQDVSSSNWSASPGGKNFILSGPVQMGLHVAIPDSVLTPPGPDSTASQRSLFVASPNSAGGLGAPAALLASDPLSPPLSASPRDTNKCTGTTANVSPSTLAEPEPLPRLQPPSGLMYPLPHRVMMAAGGTDHVEVQCANSAQRVYTTGTIRYAPPDAAFPLSESPPTVVTPTGLGGGGASENSVRGDAFAVPEAKVPVQMLYQRMQQLSMPPPFAAPAGGSTLPHLPPGAFFTTADGYLATIPFSLYSNGLQNSLMGQEEED